MAQHDHHPRSASDEQLLQTIAAKERELQEDLARAKAEAARLVEDAAREADALRTRAREQAREQAAAAAKAAEAEGAATTEQILARARADADAIRKQAEERIGRAVELIVHEVLGGRP